MPRRLLTILGAVCLAANALLARGGGGCLERGTLIDTPDGPVAIEQLRVGDAVWGLVQGQRVRATVQALRAVDPETYVELIAAGIKLHVTPEHPVQTAPGVFTRAEQLTGGYTNLFGRDGPMRLASRGVVRATAPAYNLLVSPGGVYFANGIAVHNKGCFLPDTPVTLGDGTRRPISSIHAGDEVLAFEADGTIVRTVVRDILAHEVDSFLVLRTERVELHVTEEHPFYVGDGVFRTAEALHAGDTIFAYDGTALTPQHVLGLERVRAHVTVYNLQTDEPHTFLANGVAVHNKGGGCFAPGTLIATPLGPRAIEQLALGDLVLAPTANGSLVATPVEGIYLNFAPLLILHTDRGALRTTREHPLMAANGREFLAAENFGAGTELAHDGGPARVQRVESGGDTVPVYTLSVAGSHTFLADGFIVHNKGGGGFASSGFHHSSGSGSGGGDPRVAYVVAILMGVAIVIVIIKVRGQAADEELDYCFSRKDIDGKAAKTLELLTFISKVDGLWEPAKLKQTAEQTFLKMQECWKDRKYSPMKPLLMPDLYQQHCDQLQGLRETFEINMIDELAVESVDIVHVSYTEKKGDRVFAALITASGRDYYIDDRSGEFLRGDQTAQRFQEFWTFQLCDDWKLREIEQTKESDLLTTENLFEQFTDVGRDQIYGKSAGSSGPAGPALPADVQTKGGKIDRLLNFLVQTDKIWNRESMLATARRVFLNVQLAWQNGRPEALAGLEADAAMVAHLRTVFETNQQRGVRVEHRNLCVRKVEIVHVNNRDDRRLDEFTTRISAHAQTIIVAGTDEVRHDEWVKPWVEFWTFARDDQRWVLKEILPDGQGETAVARENVDEGSSQQMLEWYYSKPRAT